VQVAAHHLFGGVTRNKISGQGALVDFGQRVVEALP
jgi:hypothetical protein